MKTNFRERFDGKLIVSAYKQLYDSQRGTIYDAEFQCRMMFGDKAKVCHWNLEKICERMMCQISDKCRSNGASAADGSSCGSNKWCRKKECAKIGKCGDSLGDGAVCWWMERLQ